MPSIRLDGTITLLSPLSHIGESIGPDSYLSQDVIIGPDGQPQEVFVYSGNAFRGQLRDLAAAYMTDKLGRLRYTPEVFYLLFSGGSLGGPQSIDIDQARRIREAIPMLSLFGGGVGNQILNGKMKVGASYPLVRECQRVLPTSMRSDDAPSWRQWTMEKSFTRTDDAKNENLRVAYLLTEGAEGEPLMLTGETKAKKDEAPQQMRYTVEMLAPGSILYQRIDLCDVNELEIGAFVSALQRLAEHPYIGGKSGTGHGLVEIEYRWREAGSSESQGLFAGINSDGLQLCPPAAEAKRLYDEFLLERYDQYLQDNQQPLTNLLAAGGKK